MTLPNSQNPETFAANFPKYLTDGEWEKQLARFLKPFTSAFGWPNFQAAPKVQPAQFGPSFGWLFDTLTVTSPIPGIVCQPVRRGKEKVFLAHVADLGNDRAAELVGQLRRSGKLVNYDVTVEIPAAFDPHDKETMAQLGGEFYPDGMWDFTAALSRRGLPVERAYLYAKTRTVFAGGYLEGPVFTDHSRAIEPGGHEAKVYRQTGQTGWSRFEVRLTPGAMSPEEEFSAFIWPAVGRVVSGIDWRAIGHAEEYEALWANVQHQVAAVGQLVSGEWVGVLAYGQRPMTPKAENLVSGVTARFNSLQSFEQVLAYLAQRAMSDIPLLVYRLSGLTVIPAGGFGSHDKPTLVNVWEGSGQKNSRAKWATDKEFTNAHFGPLPADKKLAQTEQAMRNSRTPLLKLAAGGLTPEIFKFSISPLKPAAPTKNYGEFIMRHHARFVIPATEVCPTGYRPVMARSPYGEMEVQYFIPEPEVPAYMANWQVLEVNSLSEVREDAYRAEYLGPQDTRLFPTPQFVTEVTEREEVAPESKYPEAEMAGDFPGWDKTMGWAKVPQTGVVLARKGDYLRVNNGWYNGAPKELLNRLPVSGVWDCCYGLRKGQLLPKSEFEKLSGKKAADILAKYGHWLG